MASFVLSLIYLSLILFEAFLLYRILEPEHGFQFVQVLVDVIVVNMFTLVVIVLIFGPTIARLDATGTMTHFFRVMLITWPQELMKICLFSIVSDAIALSVWYHFRHPQIQWGETLLKGALMNTPALLLAGMLWIFMTLMYEFFKFIRVV